MKDKLKVGDRVYNSQTEEKGEIITIYPEVNTAIIQTSYGIEKAKLDDLVILQLVNETEENSKKRGLLDKVKGKISRRSYD